MCAAEVSHNADTVVMTNCPHCGHEEDDHERESWHDEEGTEGMTCDICRDSGVQCQWWTWDWNEVIADSAVHEGPAQSDGSVDQ